ncbi:unnamed protein product [Prorocentrum cordatum]|uniref:Uncharacterized protein n=1 Tax=Prorocentrum cordatum TaxID=2364126 RepID=A0ABN9Y639_9DINO|nr:unnamed protein product [Polarella glacialis]
MQLALAWATAALVAPWAAAYPVYTTGSSLDTCDGITCAAVDCVAPFKYVAPDKAGTCCPLCLADEKDVPEDRSWAKGMSGGVGIDNNADPILCRDAMCPPLHCPEDTTRCLTAAAAPSARRSLLILREEDGVCRHSRRLVFWVRRHAEGGLQRGGALRRRGFGQARGRRSGRAQVGELLPAARCRAG